MRIPGFEEGVFSILQNSVAGIMEKGGAIMRGMSDVGGSIMAGVSGAIDNVRDIASSFTLGGGSTPEAAPCMKLGRSAAFHNGQALGEHAARGQFDCSITDVQVQAGLGEILRQSGIGIHT